jgi:lysophospholipase L1-like esterase
MPTPLNPLASARIQQRFASAVLAGLLCVSIAVADTNAQDATKPLAQCEENPRYFLFRGKPTYLLTSAEHYGAVINTDFDYIRYLDTLASDGLNYTRIFTGGAYVEPMGAFAIAANTLAPNEQQFLSPWKRSDQPGYAGGGNRFDLDSWDATYFQRLHAFIQAASDRGIVVEVTLFCPSYRNEDWVLNPMHSSNNIQDLPSIESTRIFTLDGHQGRLKYQERLVEKLVEELARYDNQFFEICNEPYFGGVELAWQHHIADVLAKAMKRYPPRKLIAQNIANMTATVAAPHAEVNLLNFHYAAPPQAVADNAGSRRIIGDDETGFRGTGNAPYRMEAWDFLLAGGGLMNNLDYSFTVDQEQGTFEFPSSQPGGGGVLFRKQLSFLRRWFDSLDYVHMQPSPQVLDGSLADGISVRFLADEPQHVIAGYVRTASLPSQFSVRWTGTIEVPATGEYNLWTKSNDGVRLWIDDRLRIDHWDEHPTAEDSVAMTLEKGKRYPIKIEYFYAGGQATLQLDWQIPGRSREPIPSTAFVATNGTEGLRREQYADTTLSARVRDEYVSSPVVATSVGGEGQAVFADGQLKIPVRVPAGTYRAEWFDTKEGSVIRIDTIDATNDGAILSAPAFQDDVALILRASPALGDGGRFDDEIRGLKARDATESHPNDSILFVGSSSIRLWGTIDADMAPHHVIQRGFGGCDFKDLAHYAPQLIPQHACKSVVFFAGNDVTGNANDHTPEQVQGWVTELIQFTRKAHPKASIFVIEVTPTPARFAHWEKIQAINCILRSTCDSMTSIDVHFVPTATFYLDPSGQPIDRYFTDDHIHQNPTGYSLWSTLIKKALEQSSNRR